MVNNTFPHILFFSLAISIQNYSHNITFAYLDQKKNENKNEHTKLKI